MSKLRFSAHNLIAGLALIALLAVLLTLGVAAQDPDNDQAANLPDKTTVVEEVELLAGAAGPNQTTFYKRYSADTFTPIYSDMQYTYGSGGCMYRTSGSLYDYTAHTVQLPEGAEITYLRLYFYDNSADHNVAAKLMSFDGRGSQTVIDSVQSSGTPGWSSVGSGSPFSYVVHNMDESIAVWLGFDSNTDSTVQICAVRIQYKYTLSRTSLPMILNESSQ